MLGAFEVRGETEVLLDLFAHVRDRLDHGEFVDGLGVVGNRAEAVDRDGDRAHAEETECHQAEREHRGREHEFRRHHVDDGCVLGNQVGDQHEGQDGEAFPECREVAGNETGQDVERRAAFAGRVHDLFAVAALGGGEHLGELGDQGAGDGAAGDDRGERPPEVGGFDRVEVGQEHVARREGHCDGNERGDPHEVGERMLEVEVLLACPQGLAEHVVDGIGHDGGQDHQDTHCEDPHDELACHERVVRKGKGDEGDERNARHAVGFEAVSRGADAVARVVAGAVSDDAGVLRVVFGEVEHDLHEVGADVGDLGEDAAADTERACAQGLADGEADEAGARQLRGDVCQDHDHEEEFDAHEQEADAHAGTQADVHDVQGARLERCESGPGVGHRVDPDAEPGNTVGTEDAQDGRQEDDEDIAHGHAAEGFEIIHDAECNEYPESDEELALLENVSLAGFPDGVGNGQHLAVCRQVLGLDVLYVAEDHADDAHQEPEVENGHPADCSAADGEIHR